MTIEEFNRLNPVHYVPPPVCWCGQPNRLEDDHDCHECPDHCELSAHREGRTSPRTERDVTDGRVRDITGARSRPTSHDLSPEWV